MACNNRTHCSNDVSLVNPSDRGWLLSSNRGHADGFRTFVVLQTQSHKDLGHDQPTDRRNARERSQKQEWSTEDRCHTDGERILTRRRSRPSFSSELSWQLPCLLPWRRPVPFSWLRPVSRPLAQQPDLNESREERREI